MTDRDRLIELFEEIEKDPAITCPHYMTKKSCDECKYTINDIMCNHTLRTVDYLLANGVSVLPLPIGSTVYEIRARGYGYPRGRYCDYSVTTNYSLRNAIERGLVLYIEPKLFVKTDMTRWNKTVFLTKEEAEAKLKELGK